MVFNPQKYLDAQDGRGRYSRDTYATALREITAGRKLTHWIWYVFPTPKYSGGTSRNQYFDLGEGQISKNNAIEWIKHPILGRRLFNITKQVKRHLDDGKTIREIFGTDKAKFESCMKLFGSVAPNSIYGELKDRIEGTVRVPIEDELDIDTFELTRPFALLTIDTRNFSGMYDWYYTKDRPNKWIAEAKRFYKRLIQINNCIFDDQWTIVFHIGGYGFYSTSYKPIEITTKRVLIILIAPDIPRNTKQKLRRMYTGEFDVFQVSFYNMGYPSEDQKILFRSSHKDFNKCENKKRQQSGYVNPTWHESVFIRPTDNDKRFTSEIENLIINILNKNTNIIILNDAVVTNNKKTGGNKINFWGVLCKLEQRLRSEFNPTIPDKLKLYENEYQGQGHLARLYYENNWEFKRDELRGDGINFIELHQILRGGNNYKHKYLKYKQKYLKLKNNYHLSS